jgi:hypothetical protein
MPTGHGARDRRPGEPAVEAEGGRPDTFDGNHSNQLVSWLLIRGGKKELHPEDLEILMMRTMRGHLAWCVFLI